MPTKKEKQPLSVTHPELAKQVLNENPKLIFSGNRRKIAWRCDLGHTWEARIDIRASANTGCPVCSGHKIVIGYNDLMHTHPELASEAFGWDPTGVVAGSHKVLEWQCSRGHKYKSKVSNRAGLNRGCSICSNKKVLEGFNDLATTHPEIAREAYGWNPNTVTAGSGKIVKWICSSNHKWKAEIAQRALIGNGCPSCSGSGFDPNKEGFLYFLLHANWQMNQIGITNKPDKRLGQHAKLGWEILELRGPMDGHLTQQWETSILRMLRAKGADLSNAKIAGKFNGYSEAWSKSTFEVKSIKELMRLTEEFEGN